MLTLQEISFFKLNGRKCLFAVALAGSFATLFAVLVTLATEPGRPNYMPPAELAAISFALWAIVSVVSVTRALWEYSIMKRNFTQSPFNQLAEIGFVLQKRNAQRLSQITGIQYFRAINGFTIVAHVDTELTPRLIKFSAKVNPVQFGAQMLDEMTQNFIERDIQLEIGHVSKTYPYAGHQLRSIGALDAELIQFTHHLKKIGFTGNATAYNHA
jgi:hypothetical protein